VDFDVIDQLLIKYSEFVRYWRKWECNGTVHQLLIYFKKTYDSVRKEVLYKILMKFGVSMKPVRLIKMCLNEPYSEVHIGKKKSDAFPLQNGKEMLYHHCFSSFL